MESLISVLKIVAVLLLLRSLVNAVDFSECTGPLGMETGDIADEFIHVSSSFDQENVGARHARIRNELGGGAWCPQSAATPDLKEWIEIDLQDVFVITSTGSQGRFGNGQGVEYTESYILEYWRPRLNKWIRYRNKTSDDIMTGNMNTYLESRCRLDPPIWASKIRFLPYSNHRRTICMRVEIYGCRWSDGIVSYSMPQGDKWGKSWEFYDTSYDGLWDGEKLRFGLGQLTDGELAPPDDFKLSSYKANSQGWVGWRNDTRTDSSIVIVFEFDTVREFSGVRIFCNNQFTEEVQVFAKARVYFSVSDNGVFGQLIEYDNARDLVHETLRNVSILLHGSVGKYVKVELYFAAKWMLLSEIIFTSSVSKTEFNLSDQSDVSGKMNKSIVSVVDSSFGYGPYLGVIIGASSVLVIIMISAIILVITQQCCYKSPNRTSHPPKGCDKATLYQESCVERLPGSFDYAFVREPVEYALPLQSPSIRRTLPPSVNSPPVPSTPETFYATTEICNSGFMPTSSFLSTTT